MKWSVSWCALLLAVCVCAADAYKILVVFPLPGKSHSILGEGYVRHLANAGHEITYITPFPKKTPLPNVREIDVSSNFEYDMLKLMSIQKIMDKDTSVSLNMVFEGMRGFQNLTFNNPNVQALLADPKEQFDLVIVEWLFSDSFCGFAAVFNAPYVWSSSVEPHWMVTRLIDEALNPAFSADTMSSKVPPFSFYDRVEQLLYQIGGSAMHYYFFNQFDKELYEGLGKYIRLRGREPPAYNELKYNASLMLGNSHVSVGLPVTLPQNYKNIAGYHIDSKLQPLPEDLKKLLDNAKNGLIYFSMGSNLKSKDMPVVLKKDLLKMFGTLKQTVLWKFEEVLPDLPPNVHIISWAPQPSILAHPNCVLFITHGGLLSTTETIHFGKPIIGIPVFADQFTNVDRAVKKGFAQRVDLSYTMAAELKVAIEEMVQNPAYSKRVKELSLIYHDRPVSPGAELVHWVEHVIKTNGAPHLRSPALSVPFYQKMYLDLAALVLAIIFLIRAAFRKIFKKTVKVKTN